MSGRPRASWLPSGDDHLLLTAALWSDERGREAWARLRPRFVLDDVTFDQHRLLPLLHQSLSAIGVDDPDLGRLRGVRKNTWYANHRRLDQAEPVLDELVQATGRVLVLKGLPLALDYYDNPGLRPMDDVDVLVPFHQVPAALAVLADLGFEYEVPDPPTFPLYKHGVYTSRDDGTLIDLHWQLHTWLGLPGAPSAWGPDFWSAPVKDDEQWSRAVEQKVGAVMCEAQCPEDLLLHVCVHAACSRSAAPLRWAADAAAIVRRCPDLRWKLLVEEACRRHVAPRVCEALDYLDGELGVSVPAEVRAELREHRPSLRDRLADRTLTGPPRRQGVRDSVVHWATITMQEPLHRAVAAVPRYLMAVSRADHGWQVPYTVTRRMIRIARNRAGRSNRA